MSLVTLPRFLLRAPLLPVKALASPLAALRKHPLGALALELGRPAAAVIDRYARRAAFRPTPRALWAGAAVGELGAATRIHTGGGRACLTVSWGRLAALGRALLDDPEVREHAHLRRAPSLLMRNGWAQWLRPAGAGEGGAEVGEAEVTAELELLLDATAEWTPWAQVRAEAAKAFAAPGDQVDDLLLVQIGDGLLLHDLVPPLVGPPPLTWMIDRLSSAAPDLAAELAAVAESLSAAAPEAAGVRRALSTLPGASIGDPLHAVLEITSAAPPTLSQAAVLRAASIAPLLHRLQEALAPPVAERALDSSIAAAADLAGEIFGAGALDLAALALGDYGARPGGADGVPAATPAILALLVDRIVAAVAGSTRAAREPAVARFTAEELDTLLPAAPPPPTFELTLSPAREPRRARPGTGWLLGLHAPAGATWGRFAHALGEPLTAALADLAAAERASRPDEHRIDVAFTPSAAVADLATHPPLRDATLALTSWPPATSAVTPAGLRVSSDQAALYARAGSVTPSPLARIRSTTAPPGIYQLLVGWSLHRQHAPWALAAGPLGDLAFFPRVTVDDFVIAPASWRLPASLTRAAIRRWRGEAGVPRHIQIGHEDELFLVDLDSAGAAADVARLAGDPGPARPRAWEVWPPLDDLVDRGGRRVEAVIAVVTNADPENVNEHVHENEAADIPPRPAPGWRTYRLYGDDERQDRVLAGAVAPAIAAARAAREVDGWFFLRYVDPPARPHLRVRAHSPTAAKARAFEDRLRAALAPAREVADVVTVETADYFPELARFGAPAEPMFEAESDLVCALLDDAAPHLDLMDRAVSAVDALAGGLGLTLEARHALAQRRRTADADADAANEPDAAADYRRRQARLLAALASPPPPFAAHTARLHAAALRFPPRALPALLHLCVNRLTGTDAATEARVYYLWERALDSLRARTAAAARAPGPPKDTPPPQRTSPSRRRR